jgi:AcrR family transcriptional regulator
MPGQGEGTRQAIINAAKDLFYRRGYFHTSFSDIVDESSVRRGNIHYYFKTKEDILRAVISERLAEYQSFLANCEHRHADPKDRLRCFLHMITSNKSNLVRYGCPIGTLNTELGKEATELKQAARCLFDLFRDWLSQQFQALDQPKKQASENALHLLAQAEGISLMAHVYGDQTMINKELARLERQIKDPQAH